MADENNENATTADKIAANSVTTAKLTADAVTADKLTADSVQAGNVTALAGRDGKNDSDVSASGVLDLRPPSESLRAELCRLGLEFSSTDGTAESWRDYQRGVLATFDDSGTSVKVADVKTNLGRTLTLDELKAVTRIDTMTAAD